MRMATKMGCRVQDWRGVKGREWDMKGGTGERRWKMLLLGTRTELRNATYHHALHCTALRCTALPLSSIPVSQPASQPADESFTIDFLTSWYPSFSFLSFYFLNSPTLLLFSRALTFKFSFISLTLFMITFLVLYCVWEWLKRWVTERESERVREREDILMTYWILVEMEYAI